MNLALELSDQALKVVLKQRPFGIRFFVVEPSVFVVMRGVLEVEVHVRIPFHGVTFWIDFVWRWILRSGGGSQNHHPIF
jgi:hypothetical protein